MLGLARLGKMGSEDDVNWRWCGAGGREAARQSEAGVLHGQRTALQVGCQTVFCSWFVEFTCIALYGALSLAIALGASMMGAVDELVTDLLVDES